MCRTEAMPAWSSLYNELKSWQAGIGTIFGFFFLILGALFNFHLNRRCDRAQRKEEMLSIAVGIYSEILLLREALADVARIVADRRYSGGKFDEQFVEDHKLPSPSIYPALASKLGFLPSDLLVYITRFYTDFRKTHDNFPLIVERARSFTPRGSIARVELTAFSPSSVLEPAVAAVYDVKPALRMIEKLMGMPEAKDPDVGLADAIVGSERDQF